jgi:PEP-CTERM motif
MRKLVVVAAVTALVLGTVGLAGAAVVTEEYSGFQTISAGSSYNFGFDMWYANSIFGVTDDAPGMVLTADAAAYGYRPFDSAEVYASFSSTDSDFEYARIKLVAWDSSGDPSLQLFSTEILLNNLGTTDWALPLNATQLAVFNVNGWGNIQIKAEIIDGVYSDFNLTKLGMNVTVPEPATLLLMGSGLLGLAFLRRKR